MDTTLRPVSPDALTFVAVMAVQRIPMVLQVNQRKRLDGVLKGDPLSPPRPEQERLLSAVNALHRRFMGGDYRATRAEMSEMHDAAHLLLQIHAENNGTPARLPEFNLDTKFQDKMLPPNAYIRAVGYVKNGVV